MTLISIMKGSVSKTILLIALFVSYHVSAQVVYIDNKIFKVNGCPIYFNGANTPWDNWNDFGGSYDATFWSSHFATLKANGINASRVWISCNGDVQPNINSDGTVTGVSAQFWSNLDDFFASAQTNGIYIMATMMSFDHTKNTYVKYQSWRNMLNDPTKIQTYINNYLVPFVNRYKTNPFLMSVDICNEIEWVAEDNSNMRCSYAVLQRFVAMCASAIHNNPRADGSRVLVTMGSAATKWNATFMRNGSNGGGWQNNPDGNKWSDANLKAQFNQTNAILDFYSPHYYSWVNEYYHNPFQKTPTDYGMNDKAVLLGETPGGNPGTPNMTPLASYEALKSNGYQGHFPWTSNGVDSYGGIANFGTAALQFRNNYPSLVYSSIPNCTLPMNFLSIEIKKENGINTLKWRVAADRIGYSDFLIFGSEDGKNYEKIESIPYVVGQDYYTAVIEGKSYRYYFIQSISDHSIDQSKIVEVSEPQEKIYQIYYTSNLDLILQMNTEASLVVYSSDGKLILSRQFEKNTSVGLKEYLGHGVFLIQVKNQHSVFTEKVILY